MTFTELRTEIMDRLNLTSTTAQTRVERAINRIYRRVTTSIGLELSRRTVIQQAVSIGVSSVVFTNTEKVVNVYNRNVSPYRGLELVTIDELEALQPFVAGDSPRKYALQSQTSDTVTVLIDCIPQTAFVLYADVHAAVPTLSGSNEPAFPESFHDVIVEGVLADELRKMEKGQLAGMAKAEYDRILSDLRMWIAKTGALDNYQGKTQNQTSNMGTGAGGGSGSVNGALSWVQTGLITFSRGVAVPFAVAAGSLKVANLDADLLDGLDSTAFKLVGAGTADSEITFTDIATGNVTSVKHGFAPKSPADATKFLNGAATPDYALVKDSDLSTSDVTTNNFTTAKHGFTPKSIAADLGKFLRADGSWAEAFPQITQGRLTLTTATPVTTADVTGAATVYFTPYGGNRVAVYNGTYWKLYAFTEISLGLGTITNDLPYDVFIFDNAGTLTLEFLAWSTKTARATALTTQDGVLVKTGAVTRKYLGTFKTTSTTTTEDSYAKRDLYNYYNQVDRALKVLEGTNTWGYATATTRQANGSTANQLEVMIGVAGEAISVTVMAVLSTNTPGNDTYTFIGEDSTTVMSPNSMGGRHDAPTVGYMANFAFLNTIPALGLRQFMWLEKGSGAGTITWYGDDGGTLVQSGISGRIRM